MDDKMLYLSCQQSISVQVCLFLLENGYHISSDAGLANHGMNEICSIGISYENSIKPKKSIFNFFKPKPKREFIGVIWFKNTLDCSKCDCADQKWNLLLYRSEYEEMVQKLISDLNTNFDINITLYVVEDGLLIDNF